MDRRHHQRLGAEMDLSEDESLERSADFAYPFANLFESFDEQNK